MRKNNSNIKKDYYGDERVKNRIYYAKKDSCYCVYCGEVADSREHIPSKCFLNQPYPENLYILPSCKKCNNSFSVSEAKVVRLLKWIEHYKGGEVLLSKLDLLSKYAYLEKNYSGSNVDAIVLNNEDIKAIEKVVYKLAFGHLMYSGSSFHSKNDMKIRFTLSFQCPVDEIHLFDISSSYIQNKMPEIGSRDFELLLLSSVEEALVPIVIWNIIQEDNYRYLLNWEGYMLIVIKEILYITIEFD